MNTRKSTSVVVFIVFCFMRLPEFANGSRNTSPSDSTNQKQDVLQIRSQLSKAKNDSAMGSLDWNRYGQSVLNIFSIENDMMFITDLIDWFLKGIPDDHWESVEHDIRQFLKETEIKFDRAEVRLRLLDLLLYKTPIEDISKPKFTEFLFDTMPSIRNRMIQTLKDDGTQLSIQELKKAIDYVQTLSLPEESESKEIMHIKEALASINKWVDRRKTQWVPDEIEIQQQYEKILQLFHGYIESHPPWFYDGNKYIIDRWQRYKWGATYLMESENTHWSIKNQFCFFILCKVHPCDWDEASVLIINYYHNLPKIKPSEFDKTLGKYSIVSSVLERNTVEDLKLFSKILTSDDPTDLRARMHLLSKYGEIGTNENVMELKDAVQFWSKKGETGRVNAIEKAILAIEQRITQTPQPVATYEPQAGLIIIE